MRNLKFLDGGGETGALMRSVAWERTAVGTPGQWPQSLRTLVSVLLESKFPTLLCWGPDFVQFYNDPFRPILGRTKHPALGASARDTFAEAWHIVGPLFAQVMDGGAVGYEDMLVPLDRNGYLEECYFTYSYSPVRQEDGDVGGVLVVCTETSGRVIGERRLRLLQQLAAETGADTAADVCRLAAEVLGRHPADLPWASIYLFDDDWADPRVVASTGIDVNLNLRAPALEAALRVEDTGPWPGRAFVVPVYASQAGIIGALVAGINPMLPVDDQYRGFAELVAREIGGSIGHARALEGEKRRSDALAEIDRAKTLFFSNVSHEFRTPLTLMLGPAEDALASPERALKGEDLVAVHRNALRLLKLVNMLLDFAAVEAGRARVAFEPIDVSQLTVDLASTFRSAIARAGLQFDVRCPPLSAPVLIDRDAWEKIVLNLLSNALKFTLHGRIAVTLEERPDTLLLEVQDTGVGIPEHEMPRLFERFHRVEGALGRTDEGTGIGLALVNELVRMHDGVITVDSRAGGGTTFTISIPARREPATPDASRHIRRVSSAMRVARPYVEEALRWLPSEAPAASVSRDATGGSTGPQILIVDDNADIREYLTRLLADRWQVEAAADGLAALQAARARRPSVIVADVMMPRMDGLALLRELRSHQGTKDIPVILLSARAGEDASVEAREAGADDYIVKPFSARDLRVRVEAQLLRAEIRAVEAAHDHRLAEIFRNAPVAVALLRGPLHVVEFANDEYIAAIGHRPLTGQPLLAALPELEAQEVGALLDQVYATGRTFTAKSVAFTLNRGPGGAPQEAFFTFVYQPLRSHDGGVDGVAVMAVDVTDLVRAQREAESANRAKDQFLAVLGHELRAPIAPILTAVRLLEAKGAPDPTLQRFRQTILRQTLHMARLVEDLLDVGRIITGKLPLNRTRTELTAIVRQAVETCMPAIHKRRQTLAVSIPDPPIDLDADSARLVQVVCNLLNNATKFTPEGGRIELSVTHEGITACIRVRDEGIGIPHDMLERVFDRFVQLDAARAVPEGLGIGLAVVKSLVELHGGTIVARSEGPGTGAEFTVTLTAMFAGAEQRV